MNDITLSGKVLISEKERDKAAERDLFRFGWSLGHDLLGALAVLFRRTSSLSLKEKINTFLEVVC